MLIFSSALTLSVMSLLLGILFGINVLSAIILVRLCVTLKSFLSELGINESNYNNEARPAAQNDWYSL